MKISGSLTRPQWLLAIGSIGLFAVLYWGFDTSPSTYRAVERERKLTFRNTDVSILVSETKERLSAQQIAVISDVEHKLEGEIPDSARANLLKELAGLWYAAGSPAISGAYAEEIGSLEQSPEAWSIAGSTFFIGIEKELSEKAKQFCKDGAVRNFEKAISLEPDNPDHHLNLALTYTAAPPADNPMKGVLMLRDLTDRFPEHGPILVQLGRLAIQTGQYERASERLQQALEIDPQNVQAICMLAEVWDYLGKPELAEPLQTQCSQFNQ